ncbi:hypothetical protein [Nostoc sp.]
MTLSDSASSTISSPSRTIRIGSRKSQLALIQTYWVQEPDFSR